MKIDIENFNILQIMYVLHFKNVTVSKTMNYEYVPSLNLQNLKRKLDYLPTKSVGKLFLLD